MKVYRLALRGQKARRLAGSGNEYYASTLYIYRPEHRCIREAAVHVLICHYHRSLRRSKSNILEAKGLSHVHFAISRCECVHESDETRLLPG